MYVHTPLQSDQDDRPAIRSAFFISDGTAITAETLGKSLLSQFSDVEFDIQVIPYVDTIQLAHEAVKRINTAYEKTQLRPLVFDTIVSDEIREIINSANAHNLDIYEGLINRIATEINHKPNPHAGMAHSNVDSDDYKARIDAVHFALDNDDGARTNHYDGADIILVGLSRSGKTPTSLYLALQYGIRAANYPLTEEDLDTSQLPRALKPYHNKLFGLTIDTERLVRIRQERKAGSRYASLAQCQAEQQAIQAIYSTQKIPNLNVSEMSVEEIATRILQITGLKRRIGV
ncbi:phosphoenolpyruvate synthase regulatory protein [Moraxella porci DSM 25326]|uniref:Putative phosphoenolpyruvate synthase regulatory protein n=1 Tax=Moraxella porci DSM 25326 TaxID=573983 RepID=A0A1T0CWV3_9GAMM|nr:pyruvate, water dikinase regulatory protein [Moraxella porci]OOS26621.1 phosphoenolpyruvate synthase regulatory protein [Moraxella porci DSM 25326]